MTDSPVPNQLGRYQIVRELGHGAMGVVYEGRDPKLGRRVAIKTARRDLVAGPGASPDTLERFFREARVAGMLNHANIVTVYDVGEQDGTAFIAMEYVDGLDLGARIARGPRFSTEESVELVAILAEALAFAHRHGVVHRDIKPANILLPHNGPPKLADFGVAHVIDSTLTQEGMLIGSPTYMSPEQFMGQRVDGRSDLFSLAIVLYELLTGELPFTGAASSTIMHHVIKTDPPRPHELNFSINETLSQTVMKALAKAPQDRYPDGHAFAAALRASIQTAAPASPTVRPEDPTVRMNPATFLARDSAVKAKQGMQHGPTVLRTAPIAYSFTTPPDDSPETIGDTATWTVMRPPKAKFSTSGITVIVLLLLGLGSHFYYQRTQNREVPVLTHLPSRVVLDTPKDPVEQPRKIKVSVYATADDNESLKYQQVFNEQGDSEAYIRDAASSGRIQLLSGALYSVRVLDPLNPSRPYSTETLTEDGYALVQLPDNAARIRFEVCENQKPLLQAELSASACRESQTFVVVCPHCIPNQTSLSGTAVQ